MGLWYLVHLVLTQDVLQLYWLEVPWSLCPPLQLVAPMFCWHHCLWRGIGDWITSVSPRAFKKNKKPPPKIQKAAPQKFLLYFQTRSGKRRKYRSQQCCWTCTHSVLKEEKVALTCDEYMQTRERHVDCKCLVFFHIVRGKSVKTVGLFSNFWHWFVVSKCLHCSVP